MKDLGKKGSKRKKTERRRKEIIMPSKVSDLDKQVQKLAKEFTANSARSDEISKQVDAASREIKSLGQDLAANQEVAELLAKTVETSNSRIQSLVDEIALYKADVEKQLQSSDPKNNGYASLTENLAVTGQKIDSVRTELSGFSETVPILRSDVKEVYERLGEHDAWISEAKSRVEAIANESIPGLAQQLESFEKEFHDLSSKIRSVSDSVEGMAPKLEDAVSSNHNRSGETEVKLDIIIQRLESLEKSLVDNGTKIAAVQTDVSALSKRLKIVEVDAFAASAGMFDQF